MKNDNKYVAKYYIYLIYSQIYIFSCRNGVFASDTVDKSHKKNNLNNKKLKKKIWSVKYMKSKISFNSGL